LQGPPAAGSTTVSAATRWKLNNEDEPSRRLTVTAPKRPMRNAANRLLRVPRTKSRVIEVRFKAALRSQPFDTCSKPKCGGSRMITFGTVWCEFVLFREGDDHLAALAVWRLTRRLSVNQTSFLDPRRRSLARELFRLGRTLLGRSG